MKFSYNWIAELVEDLDAFPLELSTWITLKTAESEGVEPYAPHLSAIQAARIVSVDVLEGGKNVKAVIDTGPGGFATVVCGAPNCRPGIITAYVPAGTNLSGREIRLANIGGVESNGMLASGAELGINRDATGILELSDCECGSPLGLAPDYIIEIDNKSLTHRPDLWGHHGVAREVSAILGKRLREPVRMDLLPSGPAPIPVEVHDSDLCPRYSALVFENVTVGPSPLWLQYRLEAIGLNPINNIVDVTNFVMAELAQPMHAFDADKLRGGIQVRTARLDEQVHALNGETYRLNPGSLVIADEQGAIAIAGIIGGEESAIHSGTKRIVLESANFHAGSIRKTSSALKLRTDASMRFEKAQDPENTTRGLARAIELLRQVSPGIRIVEGLADAARPAPATEPILLPLHWLNRKLGRQIVPAEVAGILESLQFGVEEQGPDALLVRVPTWRATKDVSRKEDLVEEIGRMVGYGSIPPTPPLLPASVPMGNPVREYRFELRKLLAAQGYDEVYNYSFLSEATVQSFGLDPREHVRVLNPIASDQNLLRTTLVPGIHKNLVENSRFRDSFRIFEIGVEIHKRDGALPEERSHLVAAVYMKEGNTEPLFELKRLAEAVVREIEVKPIPSRHIYEHPARTAELSIDGKVAGHLFEMHPSFIEKGRAAILDLNIDLVMQLSTGDHKYSPIRRFPSSGFDLSVIAGERALIGQLRRELTALAGDQLESIHFVRQYSGPPLPDHSQSVSFRVTVSASDRTLSSDEVGAIRSRMINGMRALGYELRV